MSAHRPTYAQVVLLVFALLLNATTWVQARAMIVAAVPQEMCLQAHGLAGSTGDQGAAGVRDCIAHCVGLPTAFAGPAASIAPQPVRDDTASLPQRTAVTVVARRAVQQPRAPPVA